MPRTEKYTVVVQKTVVFRGIEATSAKAAEERLREESDLWFEFDRQPYSSVTAYHSREK